MPSIQFPNVPNVPGVPVLLRSLTVPTPGALLQLALGGAAAALFGVKVWGIFEADGTAALEPDSFLDIDYSNGNVVANYPMEAGSFASYDKSANPYLCTITLAIGSDKAGRTAFLSKLERLCAGLDLLSIVTPEATYINANLQEFDYKRSSTNGMSMITAKLHFVQVRLSAKSSSRNSNTADPSGMDPDDLGQLQVEPSDDQIDFAEGLV